MTPTHTPNTAAGAPLGSEGQVNLYTTGNQFRPSVGCAPSGDCVVSWGGQGSCDSSGVFGRRVPAPVE